MRPYCNTSPDHTDACRDETFPMMETSLIRNILIEQKYENNTDLA